MSEYLTILIAYGVVGFGAAGLLAGEIRHPDRAPAAAPARRRERLDRGSDGRLDHSRHAARRRAGQRHGVDARCSVSTFRSSTRLDTPARRRSRSSLFYVIAAIFNLYIPDTGVDHHVPQPNPLFLLREFAHCVRSCGATSSARSRSRRRRFSGAPARRCSSSCWSGRGGARLFAVAGDRAAGRQRGRDRGRRGRSRPSSFRCARGQTCCPSESRWASS